MSRRAPTILETPCVLWPKSLDGRGYGQTSGPGRRHRRAHRVAWEAVHGPIPAGLFVCHRCDNPPCINVDHLFLGTAVDNSRDCVAKGRLSPPPRNFQRGEASSTAKLTREAVAEIRRRYAAGGVSQSALAGQYGVCQAQIWRILRGLRWA